MNYIHCATYIPIQDAAKRYPVQLSASKRLPYPRTSFPAIEDETHEF